MERYPVFMTERPNIVKMLMPPKLIYRFSIIPIKIPTVFFYRSEKIDPQIHMECKTILKKKNQLEDLHFADFKTHYKATVIKIYGTSIKVYYM